MIKMINSKTNQLNKNNYNRKGYINKDYNLSKIFSLMRQKTWIINKFIIKTKK